MARRAARPNSCRLDGLPCWRSSQGNIAANTATVAPQWLAGRAPGLGTVQPPLPFDLSNRESSSTRPAKGKGEANFSISAPAGTTQLVFRGRMAERSGPWQVPVHDPRTLAARMFREQFATRGIAIGSARVATAADLARLRVG